MSMEKRDPSSEEATFRLTRLQEKLDSVVGETHPRLSNIENRYTVGDSAVASLTYSQIVARVPESDNNPGLPEGAEEVANSLVAVTLMEYHLADIDFYLSNHYSPGHNLARLGLPVTEFQDHYDNGIEHFHPVVEGYKWYRGNYIDTGDDSAILVFQPWMQPWEEGGSPFPKMYQIGNPGDEVAQQVAFHYGSP